MTKKDYELIARNIRCARAHALECGETRAVWYLESLAENLVSGFIRDNPRFDRVKFLAACGIDLK